jgi:hypothetical protein
MPGTSQNTSEQMIDQTDGNTMNRPGHK